MSFPILAVHRGPSKSPMVFSDAAPHLRCHAQQDEVSSLLLCARVPGSNSRSIPSEQCKTFIPVVSLRRPTSLSSWCSAWRFDMGLKLDSEAIIVSRYCGVPSSSTVPMTPRPSLARPGTMLLLDPVSIPSWRLPDFAGKVRCRPLVPARPIRAARPPPHQLAPDFN
jgi:hypothetical protein